MLYTDFPLVIENALPSIFDALSGETFLECLWLFMVASLFLALPLSRLADLRAILVPRIPVPVELLAMRTTG